jgi:hypothetical protein
MYTAPMLLSTRQKLHPPEEGLIIEGNGGRREQEVSVIDGDVPFLQSTIYLTTASIPIA